MLAKQQAEAYVKAREHISEAAISITKKVLDSTKEPNLSKNAIDQLVVNLTTVLCSQSGTQPVIALGTK